VADRLLFDTDVLVDYLRGREESASLLEARTETLLVSAVTVAELFVGVRKSRERTALNAFLGAFEVVSVTAAIAQRGGLIRRDFGKSHNTSLADALIAVTAHDAGARLVTLNARYFPMLSDHLIPYTEAKSGG
jgi:predicted nucleic acid-binding protein